MQIPIVSHLLLLQPRSNGPTSTIERTQPLAAGHLERLNQRGGLHDHSRRSRTRPEPETEGDGPADRPG